ncbi:hypothetical protein GA0070624_3834 [Micromonospora rhizosphaerae]|uniref:N-acetyltransferase domain-containing protein n=1 Tax=Micromonospora rhizosphaerae TaxID=568872 RepID=A0A1C6SI26_9ACTN|nr:hypothetical protein [Micromonospora rhizosphaerae]SCL29180.1 hypothetical protein GA0070624_3834 [Micromonospora rhizosphaerae]
MSLTTPLVRARWCDIDRIVDLVTATFSPTALGAWLVPDKQRRPRVLADVVRIWTEHALLFGDAFLLPDGTAAAVWFHRYRPIPLPARYRGRLTAACGQHRERFLLLDRALSARRPAEAHNHLAFLAIPPGPNGVDRADAILRASQRWMETLGLPTYAEACTETHGDLYRRHGYADLDRVPLPGGMIAHPMLRLPPSWTSRSSGNSAVHWSDRRPSGRSRNDRVSEWATR